MLVKHGSGVVAVVECTYESKKVPDPFPETIVEIEGPRGAIVTKPGYKIEVTVEGKMTASDFDDLIELAASPVAVVCAGCKSILDIAKTLEFLETQGVAVIGYQTNEFPAFYARSSGHRLDHRFDSAVDIAAVIRMERKLGSRRGVLIANPIPVEHALPADEIEMRIATAVKDAEAAGVSRKDVTPYLLARINALTGGKSLAANIALIKNNAAAAAEIAAALAAIPVET